MTPEEIAEARRRLGAFKLPKATIKFDAESFRALPLNDPMSDFPQRAKQLFASAKEITDAAQRRGLSRDRVRG